MAAVTLTHAFVSAKADSPDTTLVRPSNWNAALVWNGIAAKGDLIVGTAAGAVAARTVGANDTVLTADSAQADGVKWAAPGASGIPATILDAKGDIIAATAADTAARVAVGANRTILEADSAATPGIAWVARALGLKSIQVFTASGTWTRPTGIRKVLIEVVGGGGGGGGNAATATIVAAGGAGGGGAIKLLDVSAIATSTITVGAGGTAGASGTGGTGGSSSWADGTNTITGPGGVGGVTGTGGGAGPEGQVGTGGDINLTGGSGGGAANLGVNEVGAGGGGDSMRGLGSAPRAGNQVGIAGGLYGGGGSGANNFSATVRDGGAGAAGIIIVYEYE